MLNSVASPRVIEPMPASRFLNQRGGNLIPHRLFSALSALIGK